jgi:beta-glucanase (GH16 family)
MARSRSLLRLGALVALAACVLAGTFLGVGQVADSRAEEVMAPVPTGPLREHVLDGEDHPRPDGMVLTFAEEFDEALDDDVWGRCFWWEADGCTIASNDERQLYRADNVEVDDGVLRLEARDDPGEDDEGETFPYTSGMVTTGAPAYEEPARHAFTYGFVEARLRLPAGQGLWPAFWLLPATQESRPEIDVVEVLGHDPERAELHYHHLDERGKERSTGTDVVVPDLDDGGWHTFAVDWSPGRITWLVDGRSWFEVTGDGVSAEPMYLVLNLAVGGDWPGDPDETTSFPAAVEADWIRVWQADR